MSWTSIVNGQTGQEVSDKLDAEFSTLESDIASLQSGKADAPVHCLYSINTTNQIPSGLGVSTQVIFGSTTTNEYVLLDSDGSITVKQDGHYVFQIRVQFGREGSTGASLMLGRTLVNGVQFGNGSAFKLDNSDVLLPYMVDIHLDLSADDVVTFENIRDSGGDNSGGLYATVSSDGWNTVPSAQINVIKYS